MLRPGGVWRNWGRSEQTTPAFRATPTSVDEVVAVIRAARDRGLTVKAVGASHSFTGIAATEGVLLDLGRLDGLLAVDVERGRVTLAAGTHLHQLPALLAPYGLALENMGDIDRQTIAGATSTGTHGTGARFRGLAAQLVAVTLVTADGSILRVSETENAELLPAVRLGLGSLGIVVEVTVQCVPAYLLRAVEHPEGFDEVLDAFEQRVSESDHFEFYWWPHTDRVMTRTNTRLPGDAELRPVGPVANWVEETLLQNRVLAVKSGLGRIAPALTPAVNRLATRVYGDRDFTDKSYEVFTSPRTVRFRESEYAIPREAVPQAVRDLRGLVERMGWRLSFPVEVRVAAGDENWMSTAYRRDSGYIAVHQYFREDHLPYFRAVDALLRSYDGRPHWGKIHFQEAEELASRYPRFGDFVSVRDRLDPDRVFANPYLERVLGA
ncbi:D-arabinono-1,4-lactone oxidase [Lysinimonas soli]|uniref:D-arabinono-1,4-lactone oxidase n=1 Tax=Lysinimonas soli TaxID=1074233 RepID=UPI003A93F9BF